MPEEYTYLFNVITDAVKQLEALKQKLLSAQQQAEELYLERTD